MKKNKSKARKGSSVRPVNSSLGEITVEEAEAVCLRPHGATTPLNAPCHKYTWRPSETLHEQLPQGFELSLQCVMHPDGVRRFYPCISFKSYLAQASAGGLAILCQRQELSANELHSYRAMRFLFLLARRMRECFRHRFDNRQDLFVVSSGRLDPAEKDILPDDLGKEVDGKGEPWSVEGLIIRGAEAVRLGGYVRPTIAHCIHYGLIEAARLKPLPIAEDRVATLVRSALFHIDPGEEVGPDLLHIVTERTLVALQRHLEDTTDNFIKWLLGPKSSLVPNQA